MPSNDVRVAARDEPLSMAGLRSVREKFGKAGSVAGALTNPGGLTFMMLPDCA